MPRYTFTGTTEETFPDWSRTLAPGDILETDEPVSHPRLQPFEGEPVPEAPQSPPEAPETGVEEGGEG